MADAKITITAEDRASAVFRRVDGAAQNLQGGVGRLGMALGAAGLVTGFVAIATAAVRAVSALDDLNDTAQGLGIAATKLSAFQLSARAAGVEAEQFGAAITKLNLKIAAAARGDEDASALFKALGINVRDASGAIRGTDQVLGDVADKFSAYSDGVNKSALANEAFGRSGPKLIAFLNEGREGLEKFGGVSQDAIENASRLQSEIDKLAASWEKAKLESGGFFAGVINGFIELFEGSKEPKDEIALLNFQIERMRDLMKSVAPGSPAADAMAKQLENLESRAASTRKAVESAGVDRFVRNAAMLREKSDAPSLPPTKKAKKQKQDDYLDGEGLDPVQREIKQRFFDLGQRNEKALDKEEEEKKEKKLKDEQEIQNRYLETVYARLEAVQTALRSETEAEQVRFQEQIAALESAQENQFISEDGFRIAKEEAERQHEARLTAIKDEETKKRFGIQNVYRKLDLDSSRAFLGQMSTLMNSNSRAAFEIGKATAIAGAVIDTYKAATGAYAAMASIPYVGPALGVAAAAAAVAAGVANVQRIKSTKFGATATAGGAVASLPGAVTTPPSALSGDAQQPVAPKATPTKAQINVTLNGNNFSAQQVRDLIQQINEQGGYGANVAISRG